MELATQKQHTGRRVYRTLEPSAARGDELEQSAMSVVGGEERREREKEKEEEENGVVLVV